ncbi:cinnamoyl-CoA reductase 1-like [Prunus yedoensis var. nudiflora]|uniref:Cinnamoyl-CoA reductase 1-like n=1 Tax=Prunus yedoensis var. nudiflora TaxID=2094558 RepID=A0A314XSP6_PRUYE|nr:cinnamoyl-CoA reductase 1-like [Prunus yedoensis var. nudiflora]
MLPNAHILAFENASASGRYCLVGRITHCSEVVKLLRDLFPALKIPEKCADDKPFTPTYQVSKERAQVLGVKFTPLEVTLKDTVLHHGHGPNHVVHCDLSQATYYWMMIWLHMLLIGIARLLGEGDSMTQTMTPATIGYMAPEFGMEGIISTRGDVYSFGIVLMETFTRRKPTDEMFVAERNLKQLISSLAKSSKCPPTK